MQVSACNFIKKETLTQLFFCEFYKISKNPISYRAPTVAASHLYNWTVSSRWVSHSRKKSKMSVFLFTETWTQSAFTCWKSTRETLEQLIYGICSKLTIKTPERLQRYYCVFIINFEQISHIVLMFSLLSLNK